MERITLYVRTTKSCGNVRLRYRLTEGQRVQLFYRSQTVADLKELRKFNSDGTVRRRVTRLDDCLMQSINRDIEAMRLAYRALKREGIAFDSNMFATRVSRINGAAAGGETESLTDRFDRHIAVMNRNGTVSEGRLKVYRTVACKLRRYMAVQNRSHDPVTGFTADDVMSFREFVVNEYMYVSAYPEIFHNRSSRWHPRQKLSDNTASANLRVLQAFFNEMEGRGEIDRSPFRRLTRQRRSEAVKERYDRPFALKREELEAVISADVPAELNDVRDAFLLQTATGCRVGDLVRLSMDNVAVSDDGIPYIMYIPSKTAGRMTDRCETRTPLMAFALEIVKRTRLKLNIKITSGRNGYNAGIRRLLTYCGITREITRFDLNRQQPERVAINSVASSKLCRRTHVDIATKAQVNMYATGLHRPGSRAVEHYTALELSDLFTLLSVAFGQPLYRVDRKLNPLADEKTSCAAVVRRET